jgi:hypothetical protein
MHTFETVAKCILQTLRYTCIMEYVAWKVRIHLYVCAIKIFPIKTFWNDLYLGLAVGTSKASTCLGWHINYWLFFFMKATDKYFISLITNFFRERESVCVRDRVSENPRSGEVQNFVCQSWRRHQVVAAYNPNALWAGKCSTKSSVKPLISFAAWWPVCI